MLKPIAYFIAVAVTVPCSATAAATSATQELFALADRFVDQALNYDPTLSYEAGLQTSIHDRLADRTPTALAAFESEERTDLNELLRLDAKSLPSEALPTYARLREKLESDLQMRVCQTELWNVNHFVGWQSALADVADAQPVATPAEREQALRRFSSLPAYIDVEIANLSRGLAEGYSAPKSVVRRVIRQMDDMAGTTPEASPFFSPAERSTDPAFKTAFRQLISDQINPALRRYGHFLSETYLPKARESIAVTELPNGDACYRAFIRAETSLPLSPLEVFQLGQKTVASNLSDVLRLGRKLYGKSDVASILAAIKARPEEHFKSKDELLVFSRDFLDRVGSKTAQRLITHMPMQNVVIQPERAFEEQAAVSSHLDPQPDSTRPEIYRIELGNWATETRAEAEIVVAHETLPGHHLQIALARELSTPTRLGKLTSISAYQEGWARYAEALAEEAGIYDTQDAAILRRIWPARGMVLDPGLHAFHWTREKAVQYLLSTGRYTAKSADDTIDRIAVMPGQLTAYDTGGLEIRELRAEAQQRLGTAFDLKEFNMAVLEEGVVPLNELRRHIKSWLAQRVTSSSTGRMGSHHAG
jgi:uncharacterized protein (DUF885 family)